MSEEVTQDEAYRAMDRLRSWIDKHKLWMVSQDILILIQYASQFQQESNEEEMHRLEDIVNAHRRFHNKVGCPGRPECYVCAEEEMVKVSEK